MSCKVFRKSLEWLLNKAKKKKKKKKRVGGWGKKTHPAYNFEESMEVQDSFKSARFWLLFFKKSNVSLRKKGKENKNQISGNCRQAACLGGAPLPSLPKAQAGDGFARGVF